MESDQTNLGIGSVGNANEQPTVSAQSVRPRRSGAAIPFVLGALVGALLTYGFVGLTIPGRGNLSASMASAALDANAIKEMARTGARQGVEEALAAEATRTAQELSQEGVGADSPSPTVDGAIGPQRPSSEVNPQSYPLRAANLQGESNAPITIIEYGDFGCIFCNRFHKDTFQQVIDNYVKTGKARFMFKQMPIVQLHPGADIAAVGSECAADQGQFWPYHELVFAQGKSSFTSDEVRSYAQTLKLDMKKFEDCMSSQNGPAAQRVQVDMTEANDVGVRGTPTFLINGKLLVGAQPYSAFQRMLDAALTSAK